MFMVLLGTIHQCALFQRKKLFVFVTLNQNKLLFFCISFNYVFTISLRKPAEYRRKMGPE